MELFVWIWIGHLHGHLLAVGKILTPTANQVNERILETKGNERKMETQPGKGKETGNERDSSFLEG